MPYRTKSWQEKLADKKDFPEILRLEKDLRATMLFTKWGLK